MDKVLLENQKNNLNSSLYNLKRRELQEVLSELNVLIGFARNSLKELDSIVKDIDKTNQ
tara:strand:- start:287 stop:463 length:177 start_codon:yes stop_codon:yes gene_type:complete